METPRVTVIIPVYNLEPYIRETLASLLSQTYTDYEAVIINDGSTDGSERAIESFLADPRFSYIYQPNAGAAGARNTGFRKARGEWIAFLDGDDLWMPDKLGRQMQMVESHPEANLIYGRIVMFDNSGREYGSYYKGRLPEGDIRAPLYRRNFLPASTVMVKTEDIRAIGGCNNQKLVEDYDVWLRLAQRGVKAKACDAVLARYRVRSGSQVSAGLENLNTLQKTLKRIRNNEHSPRLRRILTRRITEIECSRAYEFARQAAKEDSPEIEQLLWECWKHDRRQLKRLLLASMCTLSRISGFSGGRIVVARRLKSNGSPWEMTGS